MHLVITHRLVSLGGMSYESCIHPTEAAITNVSAPIREKIAKKLHFETYKVISDFCKSSQNIFYNLILRLQYETLKYFVFKELMTVRHMPQKENWREITHVLQFDIFLRYF